MSRPAKLKDSLPGSAHILRRFGPYIRKQRGLVFGSFCLLFTGIGLRLLEPWPLKIVFDHILPIKHHKAVAKLPALDLLEPTTLLVLASLGVVVVIGLRSIADYGYSVGFALVSNRVLTDVREDVY